MPSTSRIGGGNAQLGASGGGGISSNSFRDRLQGLRANRGTAASGLAQTQTNAGAPSGLAQSSALQNRLAAVKAQFQQKK